MSKCPNCGQEVEDGMKFCCECGTPIPQVRKCPQCGMELPLKAKFCFGCGAPQNGGAGAQQNGGAASGVSMGDKNVIAGDVVGQKVAGDSVGSKIMGNAIFNSMQDETKQVVSCAICGRHLTTVEVHTCPKCGQIVCADHFNADQCCCEKCAKKTDITVDGGGHGDFRTISDALQAAPDGATIIVSPGTYREHFVVDKAVSIVGNMDGDGNCPVIWDSPKNTDTCIHVKAAATLKNLEVTTKVKVPHDSLDFENGRHYEAIYVTADAVLEGLSIHSWFDDGVHVAGEGVEPVIENCSVFENEGIGVNFSDGAAGSVSDCEVFGNGQSNVEITGESTSPYIRHCEVHNGKDVGLFIHSGAAGTIDNCDIFENDEAGIKIKGRGTNPTVSGCRVHNGSNCGIWVDHGAAGTIDNCDIFENDIGCSGIAIVDQGTNPTVYACKVHNEKGSGIWVDHGAAGTIDNCDIFENDEAGIEINGQGTSPTVSRCRVHNCGEGGISVKDVATPIISNCD